MIPPALVARCAVVDLAALKPPEVKFPTGIYFMVLHGEVAYIGQSANIPARIGQHIYNNRRYLKNGFPEHVRPFDRVIWLELPDGELNAYGGALIRHFEPAYNRTAPKDDARDPEILLALGLA